MSRNDKDKKRKTYHLDYKETRKRVDTNKYDDLYDNEEKDRNNDNGKGKEILKQYGYDIESNPFNDPSLDKKFVWNAKRENLVKQGMDRKEIDRITEEDKRIKQMEELEKVRDRRNKRDLEKMQWEQERSKNDLDKEGYSFNEWKQKEHEFHLRQASERSLIRMKSGRPKPIDQLYININPHLEVDCEINEPHKNVEGLDLKSLEELLEDLQTYSELDKNQHQDYWNALRVLCNYEIDKKKKQQKIKHLGDGIHSSVTDDVANIFEGKPYSELDELEKQIKERVLDPSTPDPEYWNSLLSNVVIYMARAKLSEIHKEFSKKRLLRLESQKQNLLDNNNNNNENNNNNDNYKNEIIERNVNNNNNNYDNDKIELRKVNEMDKWQEKLNKGEINVEDYRKIQLEKEAQRLMERSRQFGGSSSKKSGGDLLREEREKGMNQGEEIFNIEVPLKLTYSWANKYTPEKAQYFNRVKIGYEWTKYNRTHFDSDNPPPKVVKGYRFNIFYPDLANTKIAPSYTVTNESDEWSIIRFTAGAPYEDLAFKIVNREWEYSHKRGYKCLFDRGVFHLIFNFRKYRYRR